MPSINMIAPRRAEKLRLERDMRRLVIVILAQVVFAVGLGGWVCTKLLTTRSRIVDLDAEIAKLKPIVRRIEGYDRATKGLEPKLKLLGQAKESTMRWYNSLDRLTQSLPQSTYLTHISTSNSTQNSKDSKGTTVNFNGISATQAKVGEIMMRLHSIQEFGGVDLHFTQKSTVGDFNAIEFEIGAAMQGDELPGGARKNGSSQS